MGAQRGDARGQLAMPWMPSCPDAFFNAIFEANLRRIPGGTQQPLNDFRTVRDFLHSPVLLALMEAPVALVLLVLLFLISPVLGWSALVFAVRASRSLAWLNERSTKPPLMQANRSAIEAQQYADNTLRNAEVIESMGMLRDIHARWMDKQREFLACRRRPRSRGRLSGGVQVAAEHAEARCCWGWAAGCCCTTGWAGAAG